jgi:hypothetical protein
MQQQEACGLVQQLLAADRVIHEQQLGWQWQPPDESLFASPHDVIQAGHTPASTAAAAAAQSKGYGPSSRSGSWSGGGMGSPVNSRQPSSFGGAAAAGSPKASQCGSIYRPSGSHGGRRTTGGSCAGASSSGGAAGGLQLHSPPEVRMWANLSCHVTRTCDTTVTVAVMVCTSQVNGAPRQGCLCGVWAFEVECDNFRNLLGQRCRRGAQATARGEPRFSKCSSSTSCL